MKKIFSFAFAFIMLGSIYFAGETINVNAQQTKTTVTVKRRKPVRGVVSGSKYVYRKSRNGVKYVGRKVYRGGKYVGRKSYQGGKYVGGKTYQGGKYVTKKTVNGTKSIFHKTKKVIVN